MRLRVAWKVWRAARAHRGWWDEPQHRTGTYLRALRRVHPILERRLKAQFEFFAAPFRELPGPWAAPTGKPSSAAAIRERLDIHAARFGS